MNENKQAICDKLAEALKLTRNCFDLVEIRYDAEKEVATAVFANGSVPVNVAMDSGTAMIRDIMRMIG